MCMLRTDVRFSEPELENPELSTITNESVCLCGFLFERREVQDCIYSYEKQVLDQCI